MKLHLEATPDELSTKGIDLLEAMAARLEQYNPGLTEKISKALKKEPSLKFKLLRQLHARSAKAYATQMDAMVADIGRVLKGGEAKALKKAEPDPDYDEESGEPIIDAKTGMSPTETAEAKERGDIEPEEKVEKVEKASKRTPVPMPEKFHDHTETIWNKDQRLYLEAVNTLVRDGEAVEGDFEEGGKYYGWSTNQLVDLIRTQKK